MIPAALGALVMVFFLTRAVLTRREEARHAAIGGVIAAELESLFFDAVYPWYADRKIRVVLGITRRYVLFGPRVICIVVTYEDGLRLNVPDLALQRIQRILREQDFGEIPLVYPIFKSRRVG